MKWNEMKWNEMKWMKWNEIKWNDMKFINGINGPQDGVNVPEKSSNCTSQKEDEFNKQYESLMKQRRIVKEFAQLGPQLWEH